MCVWGWFFPATRRSVTANPSSPRASHARNRKLVLLPTGPLTTVTYDEEQRGDDSGVRLGSSPVGMLIKQKQKGERAGWISQEDTPQQKRHMLRALRRHPYRSSRGRLALLPLSYDADQVESRLASIAS